MSLANILVQHFIAGGWGYVAFADHSPGGSGGRWRSAHIGGGWESTRRDPQAIRASVCPPSKLVTFSRPAAWPRTHPMQ